MSITSHHREPQQTNMEALRYDTVRLKIGIHEIHEIQQVYEICLPKYRNPVHFCEIHCQKVEIPHARTHTPTQLFTADTMSRMLSSFVASSLFILLLDFIVFGRPFVKRFALCSQTVSVLSVCLVCNVGVLWPSGWTNQD